MKQFIIIALVLTFCFSIIAQEDSSEIKLFKLDIDKSIPAVELTEIDSFVYYQDSLFTGVSYALFTDKTTKDVHSYKNGRLDGNSFAWYEDGSYAMQANYKKGYLSGRFLAWSEVGDVLYNIFFDKNKFQFDFQLIRDLSREEEHSGNDEADADGKESSSD
ncbi:MAG: hypothetical protein B6226_00925 [Candidatus Cloacimonetes bacterium 4572_65]|nr:MAG: hypothetical protein B6226_00925 [Candidatus Cloacimonetes bacterium 4572_65]